MIKKISNAYPLLDQASAEESAMHSCYSSTALFLDFVSVREYFKTNVQPISIGKSSEVTEKDFL